MKVAPRTLRGRLIAGLLALLTAACATVGLVTYFAVQSTLTGELERDLQTATGLAYQCYNQMPDGDSGSDGQPQSSGRQANPGGTAHPSAHASGSATPSAPDETSASDDSDLQPAAGSAGDRARAGIPVDGTDPGPLSLSLAQCQGLDEGTFVAILWPGGGQAKLIGSSLYKLSPAELRTLRDITPTPAPDLAEPSDQDVSARPVYLTEADGTYLLTALSDLDGDGSVYITGVPLSSLHDQLRFVAVAEAAVFAAVLLLAGVLGTLWVRFSLNPLRRVAATAAQVAELPLESGEVSLPPGVPDTDPTTETGQVGLAFNRMLGHVQMALRRRAASEARLRRFAADASHELRTPLAAIRGYAELALRHPGDSPEPVTHALGRVLSESTRMSVLVDELLLLARLDAGRPLAAEPVDMTRLVIDATSDAQAARPSQRWILELPDDPVQVTGDEHRLHQVLANLLSNAGKHTPDGATIIARVSEALPDQSADGAAESVYRGTVPPDPRVVVTITDNGPGIPADLLPELFERFTRADTSRSHVNSVSSTGLGLAIVDAVVTAHGGAIQVTSRPGMTRFAIILPRLPEPAPEHPARR
jgi:two-component system OmpR family sensor kinase